MTGSDPHRHVASDDPPRRTLVPLVWAVYLGCSWTWVIGMLLPAMLVRDLGLWGWVVFALPNVVGAGAMGWVIGSARGARRMLFDHRLGVVTFSAVTLAFHLFVLLTLFAEASPLAALPLLVAAVWSMGIATATGAAVVTRAGLVVLAVSLLTWAALAGGGGGQALNWPGPGLPDSASTRLSLAHLLAFIPASLTGFALCPYLDVTFQQARMAAIRPRESRLAFGLGFGVVFLAMIVFSLHYAPLAADELDAWWGPHRDWAPPAWFILLGHVVAQAMFTGMVHTHALRVSFGSPVAGSTLALGAILGMLGFGLWYGLPDRLHGISGFEAVYRVFLLAYGVVFPAYVWLMIVPDPRRWPALCRGRAPEASDRATPGRAEALALAIACLVGLPLGYAGFVAGWVWGMPGALTCVGLCKLVPLMAGRASASRRGSG